MKRWLVCLGLMLSMNAAGVHAAIDTYEFADEQQRARFTDLTQQLRCPKCQNQDIADSNAPIAKDLRREIMRMLREGRDDAQIVDYMVDRYGEFVRYKPTLSARTWLLWFGPALVLLGGVVLIGQMVRRRRRQPATSPRDLSDAERQRLAALLDPKPLDKEHP